MLFFFDSLSSNYIEFPAYFFSFSIVNIFVKLCFLLATGGMNLCNSRYHASLKGKPGNVVLPGCRRGPALVFYPV